MTYSALFTLPKTAACHCRNLVNTPWPMSRESRPLVALQHTGATTLGELGELVLDKAIASGGGADDAQTNPARQMLMEMHVLKAQPGSARSSVPTCSSLAREKRENNLHIKTMFRLDVGLIMVKLTSLL